MNSYVERILAEQLYELGGWEYDFWNSDHYTYSLGFLIDKLGLAFRNLTLHSDGKFTAAAGRGYTNPGRARSFIIGGRTAANAVCRLAIHLFELGYLTKEE